MTLLTDYLKEYCLLDNLPNSGFVFVKFDRQTAEMANNFNGRFPFYSFTLIIEGQAVIKYNGVEFTLNPGDLYTYTPGFAFTLVRATDNYLGYCLMSAENSIYDSPVIRNVVRAAYFPIVELHKPKLTLSAENAQKICRRIMDFAEYQNGNHTFKLEMMQLLYSAFLLDLLDIQERSISSRHVSERVLELFLSFIKILPENFAEHHDIAFYAERLFITPIYLSRVVRHITGRTVMDYINQMLLMESSWLLQHTDQTVVQIAEQLHFADHASFSRFFKRLKGISPKEYRNGHK